MNWDQFVSNLPSDPAAFIHALTADKKLVGAITYDQATGKYHIQVHPDFQRRGIGTKLLKAGDAKWRLNFGIQTYSYAGLRLAISYTGVTGEMVVAVNP